MATAMCCCGSRSRQGDTVSSTSLRQRNLASITFTQDGSGQHVIVVSGAQAGWIRAGKLVLLGAPGSALQFSLGITTIAW